VNITELNKQVDMINKVILKNQLNTLPRDIKKISLDTECNVGNCIMFITESYDNEVEKRIFNTEHISSLIDQMYYIAIQEAKLRVAGVSRQLQFSLTPAISNIDMRSYGQSDHIVLSPINDSCILDYKGDTIEQMCLLQNNGNIRLSQKENILYVANVYLLMNEDKEKIKIIDNNNWFIQSILNESVDIYGDRNLDNSNTVYRHLTNLSELNISCLVRGRIVPKEIAYDLLRLEYLRLLSILQNRINRHSNINQTKAKIDALNSFIDEYTHSKYSLRINLDQRTQVSRYIRLEDVYNKIAKQLCICNEDDINMEKALNTYLRKGMYRLLDIKGMTTPKLEKEKDEYITNFSDTDIFNDLPVSVSILSLYTSVKIPGEMEILCDKRMDLLYKSLKHENKIKNSDKQSYMTYYKNIKKSKIATCYNFDELIDNWDTVLEDLKYISDFIVTMEQFMR
jgi:hypothetical protein